MGLVGYIRLMGLKLLMEGLGLAEIMWLMAGLMKPMRKRKGPYRGA